MIHFQSEWQEAFNYCWEGSASSSIGSVRARGLCCAVWEDICETFGCCEPRGDVESTDKELFSRRDSGDEVTELMLGMGAPARVTPAKSTSLSDPIAD
eukprot:NODE_1867_length_740_cov_121.531114_g1567_i0.p2 GENE.NODE_1867_length_740_cov_121.531114_g1567_i0~~NODE_1867_length_740_cov_121.531114_g1567_i0.p2  ORF type:complete len:98 (-),score=4.73 NODE_1867_length_740_cov_121.531114_g1567_i0:359-652(-)